MAIDLSRLRPASGEKKPKKRVGRERRILLPVRWWVATISRSKRPEQTRTKATLSRCWGFIFDWILKIKPDHAS